MDGGTTTGGPAAVSSALPNAQDAVAGSHQEPTVDEVAHMYERVVDQRGLRGPDGFGGVSIELLPTLPTGEQPKSAA